ncbi:hypothetical protein MTR67_051230 [Solanum verrucosum]|uniref:Uncharacterized protein n=1 Tax=Solanum verrucosum TaxID=315347 RepID=A0AAF1A284_SOLVR|nr:hypothetical protein MTR67_051230 [Solanum verrucosum]
MGYIEPVHGTERYHDLVPVYRYRFIPVHSGSVPWDGTELSLHPGNSGPVHPGTGQQPSQTVPFRSGTGSFRSGGPIPVDCRPKTVRKYPYDGLEHEANESGLKQRKVILGRKDHGMSFGRTCL